MKLDNDFTVVKFFNNKLKPNIIQMGKTTIQQKINVLLKQGKRDDVTGCLIWTRQHKNKEQYGSPYRKMYHLYHNITTPLHRSVHIRHNKGCPRTCFEPTHLTQGTAQDNANDTVEHKRTSTGARNGNSKITDAIALQIFTLKGQSVAQRAALFSTSRTIVRDIDKGKTWNHVTGLIKRIKRLKLTKQEVIRRVLEDPKLIQKYKIKMKYNSAISEYGCWIWKGYKHTDYGIVCVKGVSFYAHRLMWILENQQDITDEKLMVRHGPHCTGLCVNPAHLTIGTSFDNSNDKIRDGTLPIGEKNKACKITEDVAINIIKSKGDGTQVERAKRFNISAGIVSSIDRNETWKQLPRPLVNK